MKQYKVDYIMYAQGQNGGQDVILDTKIGVLADVLGEVVAYLQDMNELDGIYISLHEEKE